METSTITTATSSISTAIASGPTSPTNMATIIVKVEPLIDGYEVVEPTTSTVTCSNTSPKPVLLISDKTATTTTLTELDERMSQLFLKLSRLARHPNVVLQRSLAAYLKQQCIAYKPANNSNTHRLVSLFMFAFNVFPFLLLLNYRQNQNSLSQRATLRDILLNLLSVISKKIHDIMKI